MFEVNVFLIGFKCDGRNIFNSVLYFLKNRNNIN